jgi:hypothetical protein
MLVGFTNLLPKYRLMAKTTLSGDVYICAAGLFAQEDEPEKHEQQMGDSRSRRFGHSKKQT